MSLDAEEPSGVFDVPDDTAVLAPEERARVVAGRYEIIERIGSGGMGQVLRVMHRRLGKAYALKLMHAELSTDPQAEQLFQREARLASHLSHPNIVETIDFGNDPDWGWFIVMEYVEGEPLSQRIARLGGLPITAACEVAAQLADALVHSHAKQVVHADLKSDNVLCLSSDESGALSWQVKLLDFGTAHIATAKGAADRIAGTPEYLAPERATGGPPQPASDIYALGVILYEMLCGTPPFVGGEPADILRRHLSETPKPAGAVRGEVLDARLDEILDKALAKDPAQRYASAEVMLADLRAYLDVLGVRQRRTGTLTSLVSRADTRGDAAAAAFDALRLPAAGLLRDGTVVIANAAFARLFAAGDLAALEGTNIHRTPLADINPELHDDLRLVALNGQVIRRILAIPRPDKAVRARYILAPASGPCGHCMLVLHSA